MPPTSNNTSVLCPRCGEGNVPGHSDLDRRLQQKKAIAMVCSHCEYRWELNEHDKDRIRKQRKDLGSTSGNV
jgi:DNA-directed RNA polymerase subunit M/transcription elongation factor TFIIS